MNTKDARPVEKSAANYVDRDKLASLVGSTRAVRPIRSRDRQRTLEDQLRAKLEGAGFNVLALRYFDFPGMVRWLLINRWLRATEFNRTLCLGL